MGRELSLPWFGGWKRTESFLSTHTDFWRHLEKSSCSCFFPNASKLSTRGWIENVYSGIWTGWKTFPGSPVAFLDLSLVEHLSYASRNFTSNIFILIFSFTETEEVFKVKKSSYSKKIVKLLKKEYKEDLEKSKIKAEVNSSAEGNFTTLVCNQKSNFVQTFV